MKNILKSVLPLFVLFLFTFILKSQELPLYMEAEPNRFEFRMNAIQNDIRKHLPDEALSSSTYFRPYDVLSYDIYLDWYDMMNKQMKLDTLGFGYLENDDVIWTGTNKMLIRIDTSELNEIRVDASYLKILSVAVNENLLPSTPSIINQELIIPLDKPAKKDEQILITINYKHDRFLGSKFYRGFFLYPKRQYIGQIPVGNQDSVFVEERLAFTMSEPQDARLWLPCNDSPHDKAIVSVAVRVPVGYSVASNGLLKEVFTDDTSAVFKWHSNNVMATYLIHAAASKFKQWSEWYHKVSSPDDSIEVKYFVWQKDYDSDKKDGSEYNARWTFEQNLEQIKCYSERYGEYPYEKYGLVALQPFGFGGMEHQTITSINRVWLRQNARWGLAHELSHMWLGDLITCKTWNDIWINEGGATFSEAIWTEHVSGKDNYFSDMMGKRNYYLIAGGAALPPIYGLPVNTIFGSNAVLVYQKASWVYHMLRTMLGDDVFFPALRRMIAKKSYTSLDSKDFENGFAAEVSNPPVPFDIYFSQWLTKSGHPVFNLDVSTSNGGKDIYYANIKLNQIQPPDSISDIFQVPVRIVFKNEQGDKFIDTVLQTKREVTKQIVLPFYPSSVEIDTTHILCEVRTITTSVRESESLVNNSISVQPNPVPIGHMGSVSVSQQDMNPLEIYIVDLFGRTIKNIYIGNLEPGNYRFDFRTDDIATGTYFIAVRSGNKISAEKVIIY